jgi:hypothetical protein
MDHPRMAIIAPRVLSVACARLWSSSSHVVGWGARGFGILGRCESALVCGERGAKAAVLSNYKSNANVV